MNKVLLIVSFTLLSNIHALDLTKLVYETGSTAFSIMTVKMIGEIDRTETREDAAKIIASSLKAQNKLDNKLVVADTLSEFYRHVNVSPYYVGRLVQDAVNELQQPDAGRTITEHKKNFATVKRKFDELLPELKNLNEQEKIDLVAKVLSSLGQAVNPEAINYAANRIFEADEEPFMYTGSIKDLLKKNLGT